MSTRLRGPFEVVQQSKNDVQVRNIATGAITEFSVSDLEPFFGDKDTALHAARRDHDHHEVDCILSYRGNHQPPVHSPLFMDGDVVELTYTPDLRCEAFMNFCDARRYLKHMTFNSKLAQRCISSKKKEDIRMRLSLWIFEYSVGNGMKAWNFLIGGTSHTSWSLNTCVGKRISYGGARVYPPLRTSIQGLVYKSVAATPWEVLRTS